MKGIKEWIQFALANGWIDDNMVIAQILAKRFNTFEKNSEYRMQLFGIISQKGFIEAIARGLYKGDEKYNPAIDFNLEEIIYQITTEQAIAISENKLEEFINKILPN